MYGKSSPLRSWLTQVSTVTLLISAMSVQAVPPAWWSAGSTPVTNSSPEENKGMASVGQGKWMAQSALEALGAELGTESPVVTAIAEALYKETELASEGAFYPGRPTEPAQAWFDAQKAPLSIGALKALAAPFYKELFGTDATWLRNQLHENGLTVEGTHYFEDTDGTLYPWNPADNSNAEKNRAPATVGQLKAVFSLRFDSITVWYDRDGDGMEDLWEQQHGLSDTTHDAAGDADGDGVNNYMEYLLGYDPQDSTTNGTLDGAVDSDGDGMPDAWEASFSTTSWVGGRPQIVRLLDWEVNDAAGDLDDDEATNLAEYLNESNPRYPDTDFDYMPDGWEISKTLDPATYNSWDDADLDEIYDHMEYVLDFDPLDATTNGTPDISRDRDSDGMPDIWEAETGSFSWNTETQRYVFERVLDWEVNDAAGDLDSDGATNLQEYVAGTDPEYFDTDGDQLPDGWELTHGLDPLNWDGEDDADSDLVSNLMEYVLGFDPNDATTNGTADNLRDSDGDGMKDAWEASWGYFEWDGDDYVFIRFLDWSVADGTADADSDGLTNFQEFQNQTEPNEKDTDGDWMPDGWEVANTLSPTSTSGINGGSGDPDSDSVTNAYEYILGFNPRATSTGGFADATRDRDGDGMRDRWEALQGDFELNPDGSTGFDRVLDWEVADGTGDLDNDQLNNLGEYTANTDPTDPDYDGDYLPDGWEVTNTLDPRSSATTNGRTGDPDGDGIQNQYEWVLNFNPKNSSTGGIVDATRDRDSDGMPDKYEVLTGYFEWDSPTGRYVFIRRLNWEVNDAAGDLDYDGLSNYAEFQNGTKPNDPDSDSDLLPDGYEMAFLGTLNPLVKNPNVMTADPDGDGYTTYQEMLAWTHPGNVLETPATGPISPPPIPPPAGWPSGPGGGTPGTPPQPPDPPQPPIPPATSVPTEWHFEVKVAEESQVKYGYPEFEGFESDPPKRYLKLDETVNFTVGTEEECDPPESPINGSRTTEIDPETGDATENDRQHPENDNMGGDVEGTSATKGQIQEEVSGYDDEPNSDSDCPGTTRLYKQELSEENETDDVIELVEENLEYEDEFTQGTPHAYRDLADDETSFQYQKVKYKLKWDSTSPDDRGPITWLVMFQPETPEGEEQPPAEFIEKLTWAGNAAESGEYEIDPDTEKPAGVDGSYFIIPVDMAVDTDRDGVVRRGKDGTGEDAWTKTRGAIYAVNYDWDEQNENMFKKYPDAIHFTNTGDSTEEDFKIRVAGDEADLAPLSFQRFEGLPKDFKVILKVEEQEDMRAIHLYKKIRFDTTATGGAIWGCHKATFGAPWIGHDTNHSDLELDISKWVNPAHPDWDPATPSGDIVFGIEGLILRGMKVDGGSLAGDAGKFSGEIEFSLDIRDKDDNPLAENVQTVRLRVAPWLALSAEEKSKEVWAADLGAENAAFRASSAIGRYTGLGFSGQLKTVATTNPWFQDHIEIGYTQRPGGPKTHLVFRVPYNRSPGTPTSLNPPDLPEWPVENLLSQDTGIFQIGRLLNSNFELSSGDYGGNLEVLPPSTSNKLGLVMMGDRASDGMEKFLKAQDFQYETTSFGAPSHWLNVGHIDEYSSFLSGNRVLIAGARQAMELLEDPANIAVASRASRVFFASKDLSMGTLTAATTSGSPKIIHTGVNHLAAGHTYSWIRFYSGAAKGHVAQVIMKNGYVEVVNEAPGYPSIWKAGPTMTDYEHATFEGFNGAWATLPASGDKYVLCKDVKRWAPYEAEIDPDNNGVIDDYVLTEGCPAVVTVLEVVSDSGTDNFVQYNKFDVQGVINDGEFAIDAAGGGTVIQIPGLFFGYDSPDGTGVGMFKAPGGTLLGSAIAFNPGPTNLQPLNGALYAPRQYGPVNQNNEDLFEKVISQSVAEPFFFVDDWDAYHRAAGEVHCGSAVKRALPSWKWWEKMNN